MKALLALAAALVCTQAGAQTLIVAQMGYPSGQHVDVGAVDPLYYQARQELNSGNYKEAAELFGTVAERQSGMDTYSAEALYWQAFALYRLGTPAQLRQATSILERQRKLLDRMQAQALEQLRQQQEADSSVYLEQARQSQQTAEQQGQDTQQQYEQQRQQMEEDFKQQRQQVEASFEQQKREMEEQLVQLQQNHRESLAQLDSERQNTLSNFDQQVQQTQEEYRQQAAQEGQTKETLQALEQQRQATMASLAEQRRQTQAAFDSQQRQYIQTFEQQKQYFTSSMREQQKQNAASLAQLEQQSRQAIEGMERQKGQSLAEMRRYAESTKAEMDRQAHALQQSYAAQSAQVSAGFINQREQSLALTRHIVGALARDGDNNAARTVRNSIKQPVPCGDEAQMAVRMEGLGNLSKIDPDAARPLLQEILDPNNKCPKPLRERAVFVLGLQKNEPAARQLIQVLRTEQDGAMRRQVLLFLRDNESREAMIGDLIGLYGTLTDRQSRQLLIGLYADSNASTATDKLISIARSDGDAVLRAQTLSLLRQSPARAADPRVQQIVQGKAAGE